MILAATPWLTISINLLLVLFVVVCLLMTLMILMQRPKQEGLGAAFGGGMTDQMFGAQTTTVLQRGTVWCATLFFVLALALAILIGMKNSRSESLVADQEVAADATDVTDLTDEVEEVVDDVQDRIRSLVDELPPTDEADADADPDLEESGDVESTGESSDPEEDSEES